MILSMNEYENESSRDLDRCHLIDIDDTNSVKKKRKNRRKTRKKSSKRSRMSAKKKKKKKKKKKSALWWYTAIGFVVVGIIILGLSIFGGYESMNDSPSKSITSQPSPSPTFIVTQPPTQNQKNLPKSVQTKKQKLDNIIKNDDNLQPAIKNLFVPNAVIDSAANYDEKANTVQYFAGFALCDHEKGHLDDVQKQRAVNSLIPEFCKAIGIDLNDTHCKASNFEQDWSKEVTINNQKCEQESISLALTQSGFSFDVLHLSLSVDKGSESPTPMPTRAKTESPTKTATPSPVKKVTLSPVTIVTPAPIKIVTPAPEAENSLCCKQSNIRQEIAEACPCEHDECDPCYTPNVMVNYDENDGTSLGHFRGSATNWIKDYEISMTITFNDQQDGEAFVQFATSLSEEVIIGVNNKQTFQNNRVMTVYDHHNGRIHKTPSFWSVICIGNTIQITFDVASGLDIDLGSDSKCYYADEIGDPYYQTEYKWENTLPTFLSKSVSLQSSNVSATFEFREKTAAPTKAPSVSPTTKATPAPVEGLLCCKWNAGDQMDEACPCDSDCDEACKSPNVMAQYNESDEADNPLCFKGSEKAPDWNKPYNISFSVELSKIGNSEASLLWKSTNDVAVRIGVKENENDSTLFDKYDFSPTYKPSVWPLVNDSGSFWPQSCTGHKIDLRFEVDRYGAIGLDVLSNCYGAGAKIKTTFLSEQSMKGMYLGRPVCLQTHWVKSANFTFSQKSVPTFEFEEKQ